MTLAILTGLTGATAHCGFDLRSSGDEGLNGAEHLSSTCWLSVCLLRRNVYSVPSLIFW